MCLLRARAVDQPQTNLATHRLYTSVYVLNFQNNYIRFFVIFLKHTVLRVYDICKFPRICDLRFYYDCNFFVFVPSARNTEIIYIYTCRFETRSIHRRSCRTNPKSKSDICILFLKLEIFTDIALKSMSRFANFFVFKVMLD